MGGAVNGAPWLMATTKASRAAVTLMIAARARCAKRSDAVYEETWAKYQNWTERNVQLDPNIMTKELYENEGERDAFRRGYSIGNMVGPKDD